MRNPSPAFLTPVPIASRVQIQCGVCRKRYKPASARLDASGNEYIRLEEFLKAQGIASTGGQAKVLITSGRVLVNGEVDTRRGRKLRDGDIVAFEEARLPVEFLDSDKPS